MTQMASSLFIPIGIMGVSLSINAAIVYLNWTL